MQEFDWDDYKMKYVLKWKKKKKKKEEEEKSSKVV